MRKKEEKGKETIMENESKALCVRGKETPPKRERRLFSAVKAAFARRAGRGSVLLLDLAAAGVGGLFAITHGLCGVYPFATAFLCAISGRAPAVLLGALCASLTMGEVSGL